MTIFTVFKATREIDNTEIQRFFIMNCSTQELAEEKIKELSNRPKNYDIYGYIKNNLDELVEF